MKSKQFCLLFIYITLILSSSHLNDFNKQSGEYISIDNHNQLSQNNYELFEEEHTREKTSEFKIQVKRYENITVNWLYQLSEQFEEPYIKIRYHLIDSTGRIILNTTKENNDIICDVDKTTSRSNIHFYNESYPMTSECILEGNIEKLLNITLIIYFMNAPVELGEYSLFIFILSSQTNTLMATQGSIFVVTDDYYYDTTHILVKNGNEWVNISQLSPQKVSPGDIITIIGFLRRTNNEEIVPKSVFSQHYWVDILVGGHRFNETSFKANIEMHADLPLTLNENLLITQIQIPWSSIRNEIFVKQKINTPYKWANGTEIASLLIECPEIIIESDYLVVSELEKIIFPKNIICSESLQITIPLKIVKIYNQSEKIERNFKIPGIQVNCYYLQNSTTLIEKEINWEYDENNNNLVINDESFGAPLFRKAYPTGLYMVNLSWGNNELFLNSTSNTTRLKEWYFTMEESFDISLLGPSNISIENITVNEIGENVVFRLKLIHETTRKEVYGRKFWVGIDEVNRWELEKNNYGYGWTFDRPLDLSSRNLNLSIWVEYSNGTITKLSKTILIFFEEKIESTTDQRVAISLIPIAIAIVALGLKKKYKNI